MARLRSFQCTALLLAVSLLASSSSSATAASAVVEEMERYYSYSSCRKLLVAVPRTSPETTATASRGQQEMDVGGWRTVAPFRRPGASLGRRVPGSSANPSHN